MKRETLLKKLISDLSEEKVTIVTGTGVSVATTGNQDVEGCKVATWPGLLMHGIQHCVEIGIVDDVDVEILSRQIETGRSDYLISAAEWITNKMRDFSPGVYRGWLKNTIGVLKAVDNELIHAIAALPGVLATLNYDNLLEDITGRQAVTWLQTDEVEEVLKGRFDDSVLHLHGWYRNPESVVLGSTSYLRVKDHPHAQSVLQHFTIGRTLLFIGCGSTFEDPNFSQLIKWAKEAVADVEPRHYVLCRTSEIGSLQNMLRSAPWLQPLAYGENFSDLIPFLRSLNVVKKSGLKKNSTNFDLDLDAYRKAMLTRYKRLKIEQLDTTTHDIRPLTLNAMYIEQHAKECTAIVPRLFELPKELQHQLRRKGELEGTEIDDATLAQYKQAYLDGSPRLVSDILTDSSCSKIVILGDPGSGKSTLLQHMLLMWAEAPAVELNLLSLPLLIELREFAKYSAQKGSDGFLSYLQMGAGVRWHLDEQALSIRLRSLPSLVLFDGLDEIFDLAQRREITTAIHRFTHEFPLARIVVTSRVVGYQHQAWNDEGFRQFMLQDLDQEQISTFLSRWHHAAYEEQTVGEDKRSLLERAINDSAAIRQLAGNPLLLTMMSVLNRTQDLPRDRAELYEQCARLLLHQWKIDVAFQTDPDLANASLDFKDKRSLLLQVARAMHSGERGLAGNLIDEETLENTLANGLNEIRVSLPTRAARSLIDQLRGRNFMLCYMGGHSYAFVHRTFLEYFCAVEIRERFEKERTLSLEQLKEEIYGNWDDETWHEVLCLLAGMISAKFSEQILQWLITRPDPSTSFTHIFIALRCLSEVRNRSAMAATEKLLHQMAKRVSIFESSFTAQPWTPEGSIVGETRKRALKMMAALWGDSQDNAVWFKNLALSNEYWDVRDYAIKLFVQGWGGDTSTVAWLKEQATSNFSNPAKSLALTELAHGWPDDPEVREIAESAFRSKSNESVRAAALSTLVSINKSDPEMPLFLLSVAKQDKDYYVNYTALQELSERYSDNPMVYAEVLSIARSYGHRHQHLTLQILANHWRHKTETLPFFMEIAILESKSRVADYARMLIFMIWKDHADVLTFAKEVARANIDSHSRIQALETLSAQSRDDPEVLEIILSSSVSSNHPLVRSQAIQLLKNWPSNREVFEFLKKTLRSRQLVSARQSALIALCRGWSDTQEIVDLLVEIIKSAKEHGLRSVAVDELVSVGNSNLDLLNFLFNVVETDPSTEVRARAINGLLKVGANTEESYSFLQRIVHSGQAVEVRFEALKAIVQSHSAHVDTLRLLKYVAVKDRNSELRIPAVAEIGRRAVEDDEVGNLLKKIAQKDRSQMVRARAIRELARGWPGDKSVAALIAMLEQSDTSKSVRAQATTELSRLRTEGLDVQDYR
jgi:hypothetical protein